LGYKNARFGRIESHEAVSSLTLVETCKLTEDARALVHAAKQNLRLGKLSLEDLLVAHRLDRAVEGYRVISPVARAGIQLHAGGRPPAAGQVIRFEYTLGKPGVWAYGCGEFDPRSLDVRRYCDLLDRAAESVLGVFGKEQVYLLPGKYNKLNCS